MRTVEEIKKDIENYKINKRPNDGSEIEVYALQKELCHTLIGKIPLDRLEEICNAEREGRCVVMPCKVGDKIYTLSYKGIDKKTVVQLNIQFTDRIKHYSVITHNHRQACLCYENKDFGKTVFLTREAAEQAKEREICG